MNSQEALDFGLIDEIVTSKKTSSITKLTEVFDEYYTKEIIKGLIESSPGMVTFL